jgi:hypothetical protein
MTVCKAPSVAPQLRACTLTLSVSPFNLPLSHGFMCRGRWRLGPGTTNVLALVARALLAQSSAGGASPTGPVTVTVHLPPTTAGFDGDDAGSGAGAGSVTSPRPSGAASPGAPSPLLGRACTLVVTGLSFDLGPDEDCVGVSPGVAPCGSGAGASTSGLVLLALVPLAGPVEAPTNKDAVSAVTRKVC